MAADVLLSIGINLNDLKTAQQKISAELGTWKTSANIGLIDQKQLSDTEKMTREVTKEFSKLGTAIGKGDLSKYLKIDPSVAKKATDSFQKVGAAAGNNDEQFKKLAQTTAFYSEKNKIMGTNLSSVNSELNGYLKTESQGITLDKISAARKQELIGMHQKLAKEQEGLFHGLNVQRLLLWAVGWTAIYSAMRMVTQGIANLFKGWIDFESSMARVQTVTRQVGMDQKAVMGAMKIAVLDYSRNSTVAATDVAKVLYHLGSAGLDASEQMQGFEHVLALTVGTLGDVDQISRLVASSYILFGNSIEHANTISEKFKYITDVLADTYMKHQVELSEIASAFTYVGGAAALVDIRFEHLVGTIGFLNDGMLKGSKAGTALMQSFVALGSKSEKLREYFGVVWDTSGPIDYLNIMQKLHTSIGDSASTTMVFSQIMEIFGTRGARAIVAIMSRWEDFQDAIKMLPTDVEGAAKKAQEIIEDTIGGGFQKIANQIQSIVTTILDAIEPQIKDLIKMISAGLDSGDLFENARQFGTALMAVLTPIYGTIILITQAMISLQIAIKSITSGLLRSKELDALYKALDATAKMPIAAQFYADSVDQLNKSLDAAKIAFKKLKEEQGQIASIKPGAQSLGFANKDYTNFIDSSYAEQIEVLKNKYKDIVDSMPKYMQDGTLINLISADEAKEQTSRLDAIKTKIKEIESTERTLISTSNRLDKELERSYKLDILNASGASDYSVKQQELINKIQDYYSIIREKNKGIKDEINETNFAIDLTTMSIEQLALKYKNIGLDPKKIEEFKKAWQDMTLTLADEVKSLANALQGVSTDFLKDAFSGTVDFSGYLDNIMSTYKDTLAENLTQMFGESTGIFANMASSFMSPLQKAHYTGIQNAVPLIIQAHIDGITQGMSGASSGGSSVSGTASSASGLAGLFKSGSGGTLASSVSDAFKTTGDMIADTVSSSAQTSSSLTQALDRDLTSILGQTSETTSKLALSATEGSLQSGVNAAKATTSLSDAAAAIGKAAGSVLAVAGFGMGLADAYKNKGSGNVVGAAMNLGISGAIAGSMVAGPVGAIIGGAIGAITGAITGGMSKTTSETKEQTLQITSAIKNSNKELQLVNRNLTGMKSSWEGFILAQSAYFSERTSVESQFNLASQSGYNG